MFRMVLDGMGCKEIAKALNSQAISSPLGKRWGKGRVHAILTDKVYMGTLVWGKGGKYHKDAGLEPVAVEGAFTCVVEPSDFHRVGEMLRSRGPKVTAPRRVTSPYLLSGLLHCGNCAATMFGHAAKSGRFHYYVCATGFRTGKDSCAMRPVPKTVIEDVVLEKVRDVILQEEHIEELVRLTNEELQQSLVQLRARVGEVDSQLADVNRRLEKLYDALETGQLNLNDLAPRIKELTEKRDLLLRARSEVDEKLAAGRVDLVNKQLVLEYLKDLTGILEQGSVGERRTFLKSFVESIERHESEVVIHYSLLLPPHAIPVGTPGVLDLVSYGGPNWTVGSTIFEMWLGGL